MTNDNTNGKSEKRESLIRSLQLSSIAGSLILSFAIAYYVLIISGLGQIFSIFIAVVFAILTAIARTRSKL